MSRSLIVKQVKSHIGRPNPQRLVLRGLGLRGIGSEVKVANTPSFRGMVRKVIHLVEVKEADAASKAQQPGAKRAGAES
jgi:large subunit ribosomal protein L30